LSTKIKLFNTHFSSLNRLAGPKTPTSPSLCLSLSVYTALINAANMMSFHLLSHSTTCPHANMENVPNALFMFMSKSFACNLNATPTCQDVSARKRHNLILVRVYFVCVSVVVAFVLF